MIRHTGGFAIGAISTRSSSAASAFAIASLSGTMPSCSPSMPTSRTSGALISPFSRCCCLSRAMRVLQKKTKNGRLPGTPDDALASSVGGYLLQEARQQGVDGHGAEILAAAGTHGHRFSLLLLIADDQLIGQLLEAMFANFIAYFLVAQIGRHPQAGPAEPARDSFGVPVLAVGNGQDDGLH